MQAYASVKLLVDSICDSYFKLEVIDNLVKLDVSKWKNPFVFGGDARLRSLEVILLTSFKKICATKLPYFIKILFVFWLSPDIDTKKVNLGHCQPPCIG